MALELVETRISVAREKLESLKSSDPYLLGDKLDDPDWVADTVNELKARAEEHRREPLNAPLRAQKAGRS